MPVAKSALLHRLPVPNCDDMMTAVATGQPACVELARQFAGWPLSEAVPQVVMNAIDPLLLETVLGPDESLRWLPLLREHYRQVKQYYHAEFAEVEKSWLLQREWWMQFTAPPDDEQAGAAGGGAASPPDIVEAGVAGPVRTTRQAAHRPDIGVARAAPASPAPAAPAGGVAHATDAASASQLPLDATSPYASRNLVQPQPAPSPPPATAASPSPDVVPPAKPASPLRVPAPAATQVAVREVCDAPPNAVASAGAGDACIGVRGRELLEAATVSWEAVRAVNDQWIRQDAGVSQWHSWALGSTAVQGRARRREPADPAP